MSLCGVRLMPKKESDEFRRNLRTEAAEASKLFRTAQRLLLAFRCAAKMGDMTTVHIRDFVMMCEQCRWTKVVDSDDDDDDEEDSPATTSSSAGAGEELYISPQMLLADECVRQDQERLAAAFSRNKMMEASGRESNVAALWREKKDWDKQQQDTARGGGGGNTSRGNLLSSSASSSKRLEEPPASRFNVKASLGSGIQKRHIRSTVAVHNVLNALSTRENRSLELVKVTRHAAREGFSFCAKEGEDTCEMEEFCMMVLLVAKHFFPEANEEFGHVYAMDRLWDHSIAFFVEEYTTGTLQHVAERLPVATFPGMDLVWGTYGEICRLAYTLVGGGSPVAEPDILRFAQETNICTIYDHVTIHDVQTAFHFAKDQQVAMRQKARLHNAENGSSSANVLTASNNNHRPGSPLAAAPEGCVDEHGFMDFLAILGLFSFNIEPKQSQFPTLAAKCEQMIRFLSDWYHRRSGHSMEDEVREPPRDLPQLVSMEPMSITPSTRNSNNTVVVVGKLFPSRGVYVQFGKHHVTMTTPRDPELGTNLVYPPPLELDRVEILLRVDDEDPTAAECVVRRFKDVRIAVSTDGITWSPFRGRRFTYERLEAAVPVALFLPRMQRVFIHYSSAGGTRHVDGYINVSEWIQFCRDYRFLPLTPSADPDVDETQTPAYRAAMGVFVQYSVKAQDRTKPHIPGVKQRLVSALSSHNFARSILNLFVSTGIPVAQGLADSFASDQWIGRQALPDVPEAKLGGHALTIRRAAKGSAMSRRAEGVGEKHLNSPRGGRIALVESDVLAGVDPEEEAIDIAAYPNGQWANEGELSKLVFRFLTTGDKDCIDNLALRQEALNSMSHRVHVKGMDTLSQGADSGGASGASGGANSNARDAVAEARERTRVAVSQAIVVNHRDTLNAVSRRSMDANERHKRQVQRMQQQLSDVETEKVELEEKLKQASKNASHSEDAPLLHHTGDGVLQAEKEALHRVFVYELEKRKGLLLAQSAREENLRDVERNRVLKDMKDRLVDSDVSFGRLQDVVIGQADTIERQSEVLRLLKDRATILTADVMYYRAAHTKLLAIVSEDPEKREVVQSVQNEKAQHEVNVESVLTDMRQEAKTEGKKGAAGGGNAGIKELVKLQKQKAAARGGAEPAGPLSAADFLLPKAPKMKVTLSAEEAEERTREAVSAVETVKNTEIEQLNEQLAFLRSRVMELGGDEEDEEDEEGGGFFDDNGDPVSDGDGIPGAGESRRSLSRSSRRGRRGRSTPGVEIEIQTDPVDFDDDDEDGGDDPAEEASMGRSARRRTTSGGGHAAGFHRFASFFGNSVHAQNIALHHIQPHDTFHSIAAQYHIPVDALFLANFIEPPVSASDDGALSHEQEQELKLSLLGIASRTLRVPMSDLDGVVMSPHQVAGVTSWSVLSAGSNSSRGTPLVSHRSARTPTVVISPTKTTGVATPAASRGSADPQQQGRGVGSRGGREANVSPVENNNNNKSTTKPPLATKLNASTNNNRAGIASVSPPDSYMSAGTPVGRDNSNTPMAPWAGGQSSHSQQHHQQYAQESEDEALLAASASSATNVFASSSRPSVHKQSSSNLGVGARQQPQQQHIPGFMDPSDVQPSSAAATPRLDPLLNIPDAVAVRQSYSFTPDSQARRAERVIKHSEDQLSKATAGISEVIASVSNKVIEAGSAHLIQLMPTSASSPTSHHMSRVSSGGSGFVDAGGMQGNVSTTSRSSHGSNHNNNNVNEHAAVLSTSSLEHEPLDQMTLYVETACKEAKKFQSSFVFQWGGVGGSETAPTAATTDQVEDVNVQRFMQPNTSSMKLSKGPIIKPKKATVAQQRQQRGVATGPAHLKATSDRDGSRSSPVDHDESHHSSAKFNTTLQLQQMQQQQSLLEERLRAVSSPDWLVVVSAPVRDLVRKTLETSSILLTQPQLPYTRSPRDESLSPLYEEDERTAIYRQRLFAKASQHFVEAELLRRLLIVREAQEFFQTCVQRYLVMRSRLDRASLTTRVKRDEELSLAGMMTDFRAATAERDALRMEAFHAKQETDTKNETVRRRELEKNLRASRKLLQGESQLEFAAQNARDKKLVQELAKLKRETAPLVAAAAASGARGNNNNAAYARVASVIPARPKFLAPLSAETILDGLKIPTAVQRTPEAGEVTLPLSDGASSLSPMRSHKRDDDYFDIRNTLAMILTSPVKLQRLPAVVDSMTSARTSPSRKSGVLSPIDAGHHHRLPSSAMDQIELVAKAEALLLSKRNPQQQQRL